MNKKRVSAIILFSILTMSALNVHSQEGNVKINVAADIVSRYVWRGLDYGASPNIQPALSLTAGGFEVGSWGAISTQGTYSEIDLYAKYTVSKFSIGVTDYFFPSDGIPQSDGLKYFNWEKSTTGHIVETFGQFKGGEKLPLSFLASVMVYGNDKNPEKYDVDASTQDTTYKNNYSAYFELGYSFDISGQALDVFTGYTPDAGLYGTKAGIVNLGISASRKIAITEKFEIPLKASLITNPLTQNIYFVLGITL